MFGPKLEVEYLTKEGEAMKLVLCAPINEKEAVEKFTLWMNDPHVSKYITLMGGLVESSEAEWFSSQIAKKEDVVWAIYANGQLVGDIGLHRIDFADRQGELGLLIGDKTFWGKGVASAAGAAVISYSFNNIVAEGLHKLTARAFMSNLASRAVIKGGGFREVGILADDIWKHGRWNDVWLGEMTKKEWLEKKNRLHKRARIEKLELYPGLVR